MKSIKAILLFVFLLSSCAPATTVVAPTFTPQPTSTFTPEPSATSTPIPTPTQIGGGSGKFIFEYYKAAFEKNFPDLKGEVNVFTSNSDGSELTSITNGLNGFNWIDSFSSDGKMVLVTSYAKNAGYGDLYLINLNLPGFTSSKLASGATQALFVDTARVVFVGSKGPQGFGIYTINIDGSNLQKISTPKTISRLVSVDKTRVYWDGFIKESFKDIPVGLTYTWGSFESLWWANLDGSADGPLESNGKQIVVSISSGSNYYAFSPDGKSVAWIPAEEEVWTFDNKQVSCIYDTIVSTWVGNGNDGVYTQEAGEYKPGVFYKNSPYYGKTLDKAFFRDYMQHCFIMYVASLSDLDHPTQILLIPPDNFWNQLYTFKRFYDLAWWPDGSKILLLDPGVQDNSYPQAPVLFSASTAPTDPKAIRLFKNTFSTDKAGEISMIGFSPDGKQLMIKDQTQNPTIQFLDFAQYNFTTYFDNNTKVSLGDVGSIYWLP